MDNSSANRRIILDYDSVCADIESTLDDIRSMREEKYFSKALGEKSIQRIKDYDAAVKKRLNDAFNIVIIGDFKRGKSTLINALLGEAIVPTAVTPETVTINRISFSESPKAEAVLKNGRRAELNNEELRRDAIEQIIEQLPAEIDYVDIKANIELLRDISIIDTPGIGDLLKSFDAQIADYLVNADALIYVISARSPLSLSEQAFLSSTVMPQSFSRVFLAVNMADTLETQENINKIKELTIERARAIGESIYVQIMSALDEFCRKQNLRRPEPTLEKFLEDCFLEFESALQNDIILQKDVIKSMRGVALTRLLLDDISARISLVKNSLMTNVKKLMETEEVFQTQNASLMSSIEKHKASLSFDIDEMKAEAKNWIRAFAEKLKGEIGAIDSSISISNIERHFQFYLMDMIKSAIFACVQRHQKEIMDRLSESAKTIANEITQSAFGSINTQIADCITDISWTKVDTAVFAGDVLVSMTGLSNIIGPLYVIGQAIAGFIRQKAIAKKQSDFIAPILQEYSSIVSDVIGNIDEIYINMKNSALDKLDELYQSQVEVSQESIHQAQQIVLDENTKAADVIEYLDETLKNIESYKKRLSKYD